MSRIGDTPGGVVAVFRKWFTLLPAPWGFGFSVLYPILEFREGDLDGIFFTIGNNSIPYTIIP